jgi:hypothetical protein
MKDGAFWKHHSYFLYVHAWLEKQSKGKNDVLVQCSKHW